MKKAALFTFCVLFFFGLALKAAGASDLRVPDLQGSYLGQKPPGMTPEVFAPGILGAGISKRDVAISSDGAEIYFGAMSEKLMTIYWTRLRNGRWSDPEVAPFAADPNYHHFEPCLSADGRKIYFLTNRPAKGKEPKPGWAYQNIWAADRGADGSWGSPYDPGPAINGDAQQYFPSLTRDGTLYFTRVGGRTKQPAIWRARPVAGSYPAAEKLPDKINGLGAPYNAFIAPDESFLIACVEGRPVDGNPGKANYFVFFRDANDAWSDGVPFGPEINLPGSAAMSPYVSPDGKYLFFAAKSDIHWVDAKVIEAARAGRGARDSTAALSAPPAGGAIVWYLGHCGYAVRTRNHLLIFDYQEKVDGRQPKSKPDKPVLDAGWIDPAAIKDLKVRVFVSHSHEDHFDPVILGWRAVVPDIAYFFGWKVSDDPSLHILAGPRASLAAGGLKIDTINSHHSGVPEVGWLVQVDGLVLYHNGDCQPSDPASEHDYLRTKAEAIDLAFVFPLFQESEA